ncbi:Hpt domain-containing protein [Pseudomonas sp. 14P_8.1_Bac3]|uniref:Hpt domain-containing protein n=1 Tax=Pseudomonas sp. 14P_8.1_Bac3 TaxID=2971621 RepID=UPI0021C7DFDA|nr:Hpt domain-containing protein [Pseudomonas sp. 14P_8.1_Bac3]MCU1759145.1 Hpt domain-containing protein [Pseudomonas sp. 14P_8.1_Bac3]
MADTHLDRDVLSALQEVMEDEYSMLLDTFLADSEERLSLLHRAGDAETLGATAHSFKGSCSNMGAIRLAQLCHELEQRSKEKPLQGIEQLVGEIDGEFAIIRPLYEAERQRSLAENTAVRRF